MSVLVKGMKMPENCCECKIKSWDIEDYVCPFSGVSVLSIGRQTDCPLVEVPTPHGRLIDASVNPENYVEVWECMCTEYGTQTVMAVDDMQYFPVIIEAED